MRYRPQEAQDGKELRYCIWRKKDGLLLCAMTSEAMRMAYFKEGLKKTEADRKDYRFDEQYI